MDVRQTFESENCRIWLSYLQVCEKACRLQSNTIVIILEQIDFQEYPQISKFDIIFRRWGFNSPVVINFILWNSRSTYVWTKKSRMSCLSWGSQSQPSATESPQFESPDSLDITPTTPNRTSTHPISSRPPNLSFFPGFSTEPFHRRDVLAQRCLSFFFRCDNYRSHQRP